MTDIDQDSNEADVTPVSCSLYDYFEIACLRRYRLQIDMADGVALTAVALDTAIGEDRREYLIVEQQGRQQQVAMDEVVAIEPVTANAEFGKIVFRQ